MPVTKTLLKREFEITKGSKTITIPDPNPNLSVEEIKKFLAISYPEILNCSIGTPEIKNEVARYSFSGTVATKG